MFILFCLSVCMKFSLYGFIYTGRLVMYFSVDKRPWPEFGIIATFFVDKRHWPEFGITTCFLWIKGTVLSLVLLRVFCG